jgi:Ca-activated chloride channel homolog
MHLLRVILPLGIAGLSYWLILQLGFLRLGTPIFLIGLLVLPLLFFLQMRLLRWQEKTLEILIAPSLWSRLELQPRRFSRLGPFVLLLAAFTFLIIAMTRPQGPPILAENSDQGVDILMALDISDSSRAADLYPNRLEAAKQSIRFLLSRLGSDRVGLAVFSGEAFSIVPFTNDYGALDTLLADIDTSMLPSRGTNIPALIELAKERFQRNPQGGHVLIIFSDGENHEGDAVAAIKKIKSDRTRVFTVGVGTSAGARIPEDKNDWNSPGYKQYQDQPVVTRLNEGTLKAMAQAGGGAYAYIEQPIKLLKELDKARKVLPAGQTSNTALRSYEERFQWYLIWVLLLIGLEQSWYLWQNKVENWKDKVKQMREKLQAPKLPFPKLLARVLRQTAVLIVAGLLQSAWVWPWTPFLKQKAAEQAYEAKNYQKSLQNLEQGIAAAPTEPRLYNNKGNALYQSQKYDQATEAYRQALTLEGNPNEQAQTWYNLGNSYFRQGNQGGSPQEAWKQSLEAYQKSLEINPEDKAAQENRDFVEAQLKALEQQKSQNDNSEQEKNNQSKSQPQQKPGQQKDKKGQSQKNNQAGENNQPETNNRFSDQEIQKFLESLEENEKENRANKYFQRTPQKNQNLNPDDLMTRPLEELEKMLNTARSDQKDW